MEESLVQLETAFQEQTDYVSIVQKLQGQLDELVRLMVDVPFWSNTDISLEDLARKTEAFDFYRSVLTNNYMCFMLWKQWKQFLHSLSQAVFWKYSSEKPVTLTLH